MTHTLMSYSRVESSYSSSSSSHNPRSYRQFWGALRALASPRAISLRQFSVGEAQKAYWHGRGRCTVCHDSVMQQQSSGWYEEDGKSMEELMDQIRSKSKYASSKSSKKDLSGTVYLVGTGPGDPELLTLKSVRLLSQADVVLYDRLVSKEILNMVNPEAFMVYVGKQQSYHTRSQEEIQELMRMFAAELGQGATVVRLKGGDPYIFGRGGEEIGHLAEQGVEAHSVPGITAAAGIAADLGIPLTHRGLATSVRFMTGHAREGGQSDIDAAMATAFDLYTTLVIYMGLGTLEQTVSTLTQGGLPRDMPAVAVEKGTTPDQRAVWAPLENLHTRVEHAELKSPTLIIIGKVVSLAQGWRALYPCVNDANPDITN